MSRQHRGISTKDLPLLPMPAPWNPEIASKYIQLVGGVGEVVRQNYRRPEKENCTTSREQSRDTATRSSTSTPNSQENGPESPNQKLETDRDKKAYDAFTQQLNSNNFSSRAASASLFDTYLHMMRASSVDLMRQDFRYMHNFQDPLDLARSASSPNNLSEGDSKAAIHANDNGFSEEEKGEKPNGKVSSGPTTSLFLKTSKKDEEKWATS